MTRCVVPTEILTAQAFRPFGDVVEVRPDAPHRSINRGNAKRFHDLATIDTAAEDGRTVVSIVRALPRQLPFRILIMERHSLGSQAFIPLAGRGFLVVVAAAGEAPTAADLRCFLCAAGQGVNFARGTWHHPLVALEAPSDFLVVDREAPDGRLDCDECAFEASDLWVEGLER